ncbi:GNAT family N-acetyltransferase [Paenibacillus sp. GCM10012306]|uniref:GNAT family N-acetyltransferase n=1 Tax=Paenibacillus sp. GCM10012306 TaxID=3317342 RepID=UPI0036218BDC
MAKNVRLVSPNSEYQGAYLEFYQEWVDSGEDIVPWVVEKDPNDFAAMLLFLEENRLGLGLPEGWVANSTFWLVTEEGQVVGAVNIRHTLTEQGLLVSGHIGYGIRPTARRKGYATELLKQALVKAQELGIDKALVLCDAVNTGSAKTIANNDGAEDEPYTEEDGNVVRRFWIQT